PKFIEWFDRVFSVAKELARYQSPTFKAIAVAHTDIRPPVYDLKRLSDKQLEQLGRLLRIAGPSNVAGGGRNGLEVSRGGAGGDRNGGRLRPPDPPETRWVRKGRHDALSARTPGARQRRPTQAF